MPEYLQPAPPATLRERASIQLRDLIGENMARKFMNAADYTPLGAVFAANEAGAQLRAGRNGAAAVGLGGALLAGLPLPAAKGASKVVKSVLNRLPPSSSLAGIPLPEDAFLARMARREQVPLTQARSSQNWMDWERFNSGNHPGPMFKGYDDAPVAVMREDGEYVILDGHHRATVALNRGDKNMDMYVVNARDYAPEVAGRKPAKQNDITADELAELLGMPTQKRSK